VARLTGDILTKMATFWTRFQQEPDSIQALGEQINQVRLHRIFFPPRPTAANPTPTVSTFVALAARHPTVAADLHAAGLTAAQWDESCLAFFRAITLNNNLTNSLRNTFERVNPTPHTAIDTANGQFLNTHAHEGDTLIAALHLIDQVNTVVNAELQAGRSHEVLNP
jgi:hypothetical protein